MKLPLLALTLLPCAVAQALTIELRYELPGSQFYDQPGAKAALRAAADFYEKLITDQLGAINPGQFAGATWTPTYADPLTPATTVNMTAQAGLVVPANTIIIYAGAMDLGMAAARAGAGGALLNVGGPVTWWNQVVNRGEPGAVQIVSGNYTLNPIDFAPWGGVIFFNSAINNWNFSTTDATGIAGPDALSVALHEMGHILGLGTYRADCSWTTRINSSNGLFTGPLATLSFGANPQTDGVHVLPGVTKGGAYGCFGIDHGKLAFPLMSASLPASDAFHVPTDLDLAMLRDIGWELSIPNRAISVATSPLGRVSVPTTTGFSYEIYRSSDLSAWGLPATVLEGNGKVLNWTDPNPSAKAFFRANRNPAVAAASMEAAAAVKKAAGDDAIPAALIPPSAPSPVMCDCGRVH
jgi:hypothetical protein